MKTRIAIFDDNPIILDTFTVLLGGLDDIEVTSVFSDTAAISDKMHASAPDIVLMDLGIGPDSGIIATQHILSRFPDIRVVVQTIFDDDNHVFEAICAGASGYILKSDIPERILSALREIRDGGAPMSPVIAAKVLRLFKTTHMQRLSAKNPEDYRLTEREKDILSLLVEGMSYKMIAARCDISYETVKSHIKKIYEKLHVASMTEAVAKAIREDLV